MATPNMPSNSGSSLFAYRHPVVVSLLSGAAVFAIAKGMNQLPLGLSLVLALVMVVIQGILWSPWGWARRRARRMVIDQQPKSGSGQVEEG